MLDKIFAPDKVSEALVVLQNEFPLALWETVYVTVLATALAIVIGLPLGVLLATGDITASCLFLSL